MRPQTTAVASSNHADCDANADRAQRKQRDRTDREEAAREPRAPTLR